MRTPANNSCFLSQMGNVQATVKTPILKKDKAFKFQYQNIYYKNVNLLGYVSSQKNLINIYDSHNIMVLPSYTEATPYVVDEALSRKRPVIIFDDISYIVRDKKGIFIAKRDKFSFLKTTRYIIDNYSKIQSNMEENKLPTKKSMIKQISDIIENQNNHKFQ